MTKILNNLVVLALMTCMSAMAILSEDMNSDPRQEQQKRDKIAYKEDPIFRGEIEGHMKSQSSGCSHYEARGKTKVEAPTNVWVWAKNLVSRIPGGIS